MRPGGDRPAGPAELPGEAYAAALAGLPGMGPSTLLALLRRHGPRGAWEAVRSGAERRPAAGRRPRSPEPVAPLLLPQPAPEPDGAAWERAAGRIDVAARWAALVAAGITVSCHGGPGYPAALLEDPQPPAVLFALGDASALAASCVAVIGTRRATHYGREVAFELGRDLARAGVCVVSGLALGIDGAAHLGALDAGGAVGPVGVAASGVDVVYPRRHAELWSRVVAAGAVLSETAPGQAAQAWRFPARNRIIAGLCRAVVIVESHLGGGSMLTVNAALARGVEVLAVPGPVHSLASEGTNQLLVEGSRPVRHAGDVLDALGDVRPWPPPGGAGPAGVVPGWSMAAPADARPVLEAVDWTPTPPGVVASRTGLAIGPLARALHRLEALGLVRHERGLWERVRPS